MNEEKEEVSVFGVDSSEDTSSEVISNTDAKSAKPKKSKKKLIILIFSIIQVLLIALCLFLFVFPKKDKKTVEIDDVKIIQGYGKLIEDRLKEDDDVVDFLDLVKDLDYEYEVDCREHEVYEDGTIYLNQCSIDGKSVKASYGKKLVLEEKAAGAILVYVSKSSHKATLTEPKNVKDYDVYDFDINERYTNLELLSDTSEYVFYMNNENKGQLIYYKTGKKVLEDVEYDSILPIKYNNSYDENYVAVGREGTTPYRTLWAIYDIQTNKQIIPFKISVLFGKGSSSVKVKFYVDSPQDGIISAMTDEGYYTVFNYRTGKSIASSRNVVQKMGSYLVTNDENTKIYDYSGREYLTNRKILSAASEDYILIREDDGHVKIISIDEKEVYDFGEYSVYENFSNKIDGNVVIMQVRKNKNNYNKCYQFQYFIKENKGMVSDVICNSSPSSIDAN